ncbi:hypothetical protein LTR37_017214 [Vermiconidia calcicola]|uniref:Uncharacterized protein n=1 Tax=Vermiconidia calcicola TaxID=1690605 RepID=A0ACC3MKQ5_9PEZI|nr:hypothetical protein LTR37_017214 [Vermiconidia calcicola]
MPAVVYIFENPDPASYPFGFEQYADASAPVSVMPGTNQNPLGFDTMPPLPKRQFGRGSLDDIYIPNIVEENAADSEKSKHVTNSPAMKKKSSSTAGTKHKDDVYIRHQLSL